MRLLEFVDDERTPLFPSTARRCDNCALQSICPAPFLQNLFCMGPGGGLNMSSILDDEKYMEIIHQIEDIDDQLHAHVPATGGLKK